MFLAFKPTVQIEEFYDTWSAKIVDCQDETNVIVEYLIKESLRNTKRCNSIFGTRFKLQLKELTTKLHSLENLQPKTTELIQKLGVNVYLMVEIIASNIKLFLFQVAIRRWCFNDWIIAVFALFACLCSM